MSGADYKILKDTLIDMGYNDEIDWQTNLTECTNGYDFACEAIWVILNSGMKEQIARKIWERIKEAWRKEIKTSDVFKHTGKAKAIDFVWDNQAELFEKYCLSEDKISFLQTIPFIGGITKYHLAKNLGHDCVKPDRHLVKIAGRYGKTPDQLCEDISRETGDKKCVVDIVIWRACNIQLLN